MWPKSTQLVLALASMVLPSSAGCAAPRTGPPSPDLERRAREALRAAVGYEYNPAVRAAGVEALREVGGPDALPWIRSALLDDHAAVRFAACVAIGELRDEGAAAAIRERLNDADPHVQVAALFASHQLGNRVQSGRISAFLLQHPDPKVRRNAALVLGLTGESSAVKVLARAMKDADSGVRYQTLEAMARLGNAEARQELAFLTTSGVGAEEVFAINALAATRDPRSIETFRYKFDTATHTEVRLAAARGLALHGSTVGFEPAIAALRPVRKPVTDVQDSAEGQSLRIRQLACAALGAMKDVRALSTLDRIVSTDPDPRIQISAALAVMQILQGADQTP